MNPTKLQLEIEERRLEALKKSMVREIDGYDVLAPFRTWPKFHQDRFLSYNKAHEDWAKMFTFLWLNGMDPNLCYYFLVYWMHPMRVPKYAAHNVPSPSHERDFKALVSSASARVPSKEHYRLVRYAHWDLEMGRSVPGYSTWEEYANAMRRA